MRRIAFCLYALVLALPLVGCKKDTAPVSSDPAAPAGDADKDGDANATDAEPADPAAK